MAEAFAASKGRYGYRRIKAMLRTGVSECVCSIESGPCERVESLQMSGRF